MAAGNETELERMVIRLVGDMSGYLDTLKKAQTETKQGIDSMVAEGERLTERFKAPAEKYTAQLEKLQEMYAKGAVSVEVYVKALKEVEEAQKKAAAAEAAKTPKGLQDMAGKVGPALKTITNATDILKGKFESVGDGMRQMGDLASTIPGPWGAALGGVLQAGGALTDWMTKPLRAAQESARAGFFSVAEGAQSMDQAIRNIGTEALKKAMEDIIDMRNTGEQLQSISGSIFNGPGGTNPLFQTMQGAVELGTAGAEVAATEQAIRRLEGAVRRARAEMESLFNNPNLRPLVERYIVGQVGGALVEHPEQARESSLRRQMFRAMRGPGTETSDAQAVEAIRRLQELQISRRTGGRGLEDPQAQRQAREDLAQAQQSFRENMSERRQETARSGLEDTTESMLRQAGTAGMAADAASRYNAIMDMARATGTNFAQAQRMLGRELDTNRAATAATAVGKLHGELQTAVEQGSLAFATFRTFNQTVDGSRDAMGVATTTTESLARQEVIANRERERSSLLLQLQDANLNRLSASARARIQQQLQTIDTNIAEMRSLDRLTTAAELNRNAAQAGYQITQQVRTPVEVYTDRLAELRNVLDRNGTSITAHARAVQQASEAYQRADPTLRLYLSDVEQGVSIANQFRAHMEGTADQVQALDRALASGRITADEHARALGGIAEQLGRVNGELHGTPAAARGSAEALARITAYQERLRAGVMNEGQLQRFREIARPRDQERLRQQGEQARQEQLMLAEVFEEEQGEARRETQRQHQEFLADWWQEQQVAVAPAAPFGPEPAEQARRAGNPVPGGGNAGGGDVGGGVPGGGDAGGGDVGGGTPGGGDADGGDVGSNAPEIVNQLRQAVDILRMIANSGGGGFFGAGLGT